MYLRPNHRLTRRTQQQVARNRYDGFGILLNLFGGLVNRVPHTLSTPLLKPPVRLSWQAIRAVGAGTFVRTLSSFAPQSLKHDLIVYASSSRGIAYFAAGSERG